MSMPSYSAPEIAPSVEQPLLFEDLGPRRVEADFRGGHISSDGGALLLRQLDLRGGYLRRFAKCFRDHRNPELIEHTLEELLRQRVYALALGYEDLNDHEHLRVDPLLAAACGKRDVTGEHRLRLEDRGHALAGKSTLNRLELTPADAGPAQRYKKIVAEMSAVEQFFIDEYVRSLPGDSREVMLDLDATDDPIHGHQEGRFFHGYYDQYCYLPLYIFGGKWPILARLRPSNIDASEGALEAVAQIVVALRKRFPHLKIVLRADSGFCRDALMTWCQLHGVYFIFGLARNPVLERKLAHFLEQARVLSEADGGKPSRVFTGFAYRAKTWMALRWVVAKAEWTQGEANPRFVVTNLNPLETSERQLYEELYCARGEMENRIKEQQLDLFADRTSTETLRANQLRLWFSTLAYLLLNQLRQIGLRGTPWQQVSCGTLRLRLLKIGTLVRVSVRRLYCSMSSAFPLRELFGLVLRRLNAWPSTA